MSFTHVFNRLLRTVWLFISTLTVEPIAFLNFMGFQLFMVAHHTGLYEVICYQTFPNNVHTAGHGPSLHSEGEAAHDHRHSGGNNGGGGRGGHGAHGVHNNQHSNFSNHSHSEISNLNLLVDCNNLRLNPSAENLVQERMSEFNMYMSMVHIIPGILAHVFLGAWGDKHGRKINILVGITGMVINAMPFIVLFEFKFMPLWILLITSFVASCTGSMGSVMISSFAYLADIIVKRENLTVRMTIYTIIMTVSGVFGSFLAAICLKYLRFSYIVLIMVCILTISFFYSLIRLKQIPPAIMKKLMREKEARMAADDENVEMAKKVPKGKEKMMLGDIDKKWELEKTKDDPNLSLSEKLLRSIKGTTTMLVDVWRTYTKPRPYRNRIYLLLMAFTFFLSLLSQMGNHISGLYLFKAPISWDGEKLAYWKATGHIVHFFGTLLGVLILKKLLKFRETTILLIAVASHFLQEIIIAFAQNGWMLYLSTCLGCLSPLFMPTIKSFIAQMVDPDEVGKSFIMFGLAHDIGMILSSISSNAIYKATLRFMPGFLFLMCSGFLCISFSILVFIHIDMIKREKNLFKTDSVDTVEQLKNGVIDDIAEQVAEES